MTEGSIVKEGWLHKRGACALGVGTLWPGLSNSLPDFLEGPEDTGLPGALPEGP